VLTRGWHGSQPRSDLEARDRIVEAARVSVQRFGVEKTTLADIAAELGVTRPTVYRHFSSIAEIFLGVALATALRHAERVAARVSGIADPTDAVIEALVCTVDALPEDPLLGLLLTGHLSTSETTRSMSAAVNTLGMWTLEGMPCPWTAHGYGDDDLAELGVYLLRAMKTLAAHPTPAN